MLRRTTVIWMTVHSPRALPFTVAVDEAVPALKEKYDSRWFGTSPEHIDFARASPEYIPFFLLNGSVSAVYKAQVEYKSTYRNANGQTVTTRTYRHVGPLKYGTTFEESNTQVYGGYRYNNRHIKHVLSCEEIANDMVRAKHVDLGEGEVNLFEMSTTSLIGVAEGLLRDLAREELKASIRSSHPGSNSVTVSFSSFRVKIKHVTPVFVPCHVMKLLYDDQEYTAFVNAHTGKAGGPYLINSLGAGRISAAATFGTALMLMPNKVYAMAMGSVFGVVAYYVGFYAAKKIPYWYWQREDEKQATQQAENRDADEQGYRPQPDSTRTEQAQSEEEENANRFRANREQMEREYERSKQREASRDQRKQAHQTAKSDPKGYYAALGVDRGASVNEIRSGYRKAVLKAHPDTGGSSREMILVNEAYRVLRNPARRDEYDRSAA